MEVFQELGSDNATEILLEIRNDVKCMNRKFDSLDKKVKNLRNDNKVLKKQNTKLVDQVAELSSTVVNLETRVKEAEKKNENLEAQSRRENLKFYGIEDDRRETWEQTELKTRNYLSTQLDIDESNIQIERAHRLPSRSNPRPVIVINVKMSRLSQMQASQISKVVIALRGRSESVKISQRELPKHVQIYTLS